MRATHRIIGCVLCIVGFGSAAAANLETQDLGGSQQTLLDSSNSASGGGASGGDALGIARDSTPTSGSSSGSASHTGNDRSGGGATAPTPTQRPHLGWQSLLPGSIQ